MEIKTIGIVGCGLMGSGIAETCSKAGYDVIVREINQEFLDGGMARVGASLGRAVKKGKVTEEEREQIFGRIKPTVEMGELEACQYVIEAVPESMELKKETFRELDRICPPEAILTSNTSSLSIAEIGAVTSRAEKILGMHFFNPVPVMKLLEIVRAIETSDETYEVSHALGESLGKKVITAKDNPGFIVNYLLVPYLLAAVRAVESGVGIPEDLDTGMTLGCGHPMGPITLLDFVGLDTTLFIADAMFEEFKDPMYGAPPLLRRMVSAGRLGKKSGRGFYDY